MLLTAVDLDLLCKGHRGKSENFSHLLGDGSGVAVGGFGCGDDQVGATELLHCGGEHFCRGERITSLQGGVGDKNTLDGAHGQRGTHTGGFTIGCHGDEADLATTGGIDKLQCHLHAVGVGVVEDQFSVTLQGVGCAVERTRRGGVRNLLHTDDDVHSSSIVTGRSALRLTAPPDSATGTVEVL